jgi:hypothetical protein
MPLQNSTSLKRISLVKCFQHCFMLSDCGTPIVSSERASYSSDKVLVSKDHNKLEQFLVFATHIQRMVKVIIELYNLVNVTVMITHRFNPSAMRFLYPDHLLIRTPLRSQLDGHNLQSLSYFIPTLYLAGQMVNNY